MYELDYILFQCQHKDYVKTLLNVFRFESSLLQRKQQKQKQKKTTVSQKIRPS